MPCPRCGAVIDAAGEDDLVAKVQPHVRVDHGLEHAMPAKHIPLHDLDPVEPADRGSNPAAEAMMSAESVQQRCGPEAGIRRMQTEVRVDPTASDLLRHGRATVSRPWATDAR